MNKSSLIHSTAILMMGVCLYTIFSQWDGLSHLDRLSPNAKSILIFWILILIIISVCGIFSSICLYFCKPWSRSLTIGIAAIFLLISLPSHIRMVFSSGRPTHFDVSSTIHALFALWCFYCLNRSDVKEMLKNQSQPTISLTSQPTISPSKIIEASNIEKVMSGQKLIIYAVIINVLTAVLQAIFGEMVGLVSIIAIIVSFKGLLYLFSGLNFSNGKKILIIIFILIPYVNIIPLLMLNSCATKVLRDAGYKVGLLGAHC